MSGEKRTADDDLDVLERDGQRIAAAPTAPPRIRPTLRPTAWPRGSAIGPMWLTARSPPMSSPAEAPPMAPAAAVTEVTASSKPVSARLPVVESVGVHVASGIGEGKEANSGVGGEVLGTGCAACGAAEVGS